VSDYLLNFSHRHDLGIRLDEARILYHLIDCKRVDKKRWSELLRVPYTSYISIIKGKRIIPLTVWSCLYELSFSLDWFISGEGIPFRSGLPDKINAEKISDIRPSDKVKLIQWFLHYHGFFQGDKS
jgi:hypothetical protein